MTMAVSAGPRLQIATSATEVVEAWQLLYRSYVDAGYIRPNPFELHTVPEAVGPQSLVMLAFQNDLPVSTITAMADSTRGLPLDSVYPRELDEIRASGSLMVEVGLFGCIDEKSTFATVFDLMRYTFFYAIMLGADEMICGIPPRRVGLYERMLGFEQLGAIKSYSTVKNNPVALMRGKIRHMLDHQASYRAVAYAMKHPLPESTFDQRFMFTKAELSNSLLDRYLQYKGQPPIGVEVPLPEPVEIPGNIRAA